MHFGNSGTTLGSGVPKYREERIPQRQRRDCLPLKRPYPWVAVESRVQLANFCYFRLGVLCCIRVFRREKENEYVLLLADFFFLCAFLSRYELWFKTLWTYLCSRLNLCENVREIEMKLSSLNDVWW